MNSYLTLALIAVGLGSHLCQAVPSGPSTETSKRFSRLLHDNAAALQFSSISNLAPPLSSLSPDSKERKAAANPSPTNFGRRTLDYDDSESFDVNGEPLPQIISQPSPGNEFVYIRGGVQSDGQSQSPPDASVTSINKQAPNSNRIPITLLRQSDGKAVNLSPVFSSPDSAGVQVPFFYQDMLNGRADIAKEEEPKMVVNVVTSAPRMESAERKETEPEAVTSVPTTTTTTTTTTQAPPTTSSTSATTTTTAKPKSVDETENLVVQSSRRMGSFPDFEDSPTKLQTSETNTQPARVNVKPSSSGKEYEYEYIYYYYDDDEENNGTTKAVGGQKQGPAGNAKGTPTQGKQQKEHEVAASPDFEDEDLEEVGESPVSQSPPSAPSTRATVRPTPTSTTTTRRPTTTTTTTTTTTPPPARFSPADKFSGGVVNEIQGARSPKVFQTEKVHQAPTADYKIEAGEFPNAKDSDSDSEAEYEYEYEEEEVQDKAKGQPQRQPSAEEEEEGKSPIAMVVVPAAHPSSVNTPIVLKQSNLLQAVPASRLHPAPEEVVSSPPSTTTSTTATTTTTTTTEAAPTRTRFRGQQRIRGGHEAEATPAAPKEEETPARARPTITRGRIPSRRPTVEATSESTEASSPSPRPSGTRSRFPARSTTSTAPPSPPPSTTATVSAPAEQEEARDGESFVKNKAANDLFTFTRLQQAISSRAPVRKELTTAPIPVQHQQQIVSVSSSSSSDSEQSSDEEFEADVTTVQPAPEHIEEEPTSTTTTTTTTPTTTTTTTTTTATPTIADKIGRQRNRFATGRRPTTPAQSNNNAESGSTTEASARTPGRGRFNRRRPTSPAPESTEGGGDAPTSPAPSVAPERARLPTRNRFSTRTRSTTEAPAHAAEEHKSDSSSEPAPTPASTGARRRPIFQNRRRIQPTQAAAEEHKEQADPVPSPSSNTAESSAAPEPERRRPGLPQGQRRRPGAGAGPRRGGRLGGPTTAATTEKASEVSEQASSEPAQPTTANEEQSETPAAPSSASPPAEQERTRGNSGVVGRLRTKPRLPTAATTTAAPEASKERKPSRLNGILGRRKPLPPTATTPAPKEHEVEDPNTAQEQTEDGQHKGVVVQVSSSVTESEEVHPGEVVEPASSTPGSILNRLKTQRKPGSIFRKRTEPTAE